MFNIGKVNSFHGVKGEIRILSNFEKKDLVFKKGFNLYIDNKKYEIKTYRHHKQYEMVTFNEFDNLNDVLFLKNKDVYILKTDLNLNDNYVIDELVGYEVYFNEDYCGKITDFVYNNINNLLIIKNYKEFYIPYHDNFIEKVDKKDKRIYLKNIEGLIE